MRQGAENEISVAEGRVLSRRECQLIATKLYSLPALAMRGCEPQLHFRMLPNEQTELPARVPARAEDSDSKFMHR